MKDSAKGQRPEAISPSIKEIKGGMPPATPPGSPATTPADAAARRIVAAIEGRSQLFPSANDYHLVARALLASKPSAWRSMESAPVTEPMKHVRVMVWSKQIGVAVGDLHRWKGDAATVNIGPYHGDAVALWGVTHWQPLPEPPAEGGK